MLKQGFFFLRRAYNDLIDPNRFGVSPGYTPEWHPGTPFPYGLDYTSEGMAAYYDMIFDQDGIVMMAHYIDHLEDAGAETHYYSPVKIAHYALGAYNDFLKTGERRYEEGFEKHAAWLVERAEPFAAGGVVWRTPSSNPKYELGVNYISAIVQGLAISALVRAFLHFDDERYLRTARAALPVLSVPVEEGGLLAESRWGPAYEEYPAQPYSHVVNGFMFCLMGLHDLISVADDQEARRLYEAGLDTLERMIPAWRLPHWSRYDLRDLTKGGRPNWATRHYHYLHIDQLELLYRQSGRPLLAETRAVFMAQLRSPINAVRIYVNKFQKLILKA